MRKNMPIGTVKFWKPESGYGFSSRRTAVLLPMSFVHVSAVRAAGFSDLSRGQRVQFQIGTNARTGRDQAADLTLLDPVISPPGDGACVQGRQSRRSYEPHATRHTGVHAAHAMTNTPPVRTTKMRIPTDARASARALEKMTAIA
jgi:cold shock protein